MKAIYRYVSLAVGVLFSGALAAQNLDPTVEISRAYEGKISEAQKPAREMTVPDSVSTFRLDFDYSVFDKPYKGAYDFNPYLMDMRPSSVAYDPQTFYLKAGAGYRLQPELEMVWSPALSKGVDMNIYASHKSYVGDYRNIALADAGTGNMVLDESDRTGRFNGYDLMSKAGFDMNFGWTGGQFGFNADYYGLAGKTHWGLRNYDAVDIDFRLASNKNEGRNFIYDLNAGYRYGADKMHYSSFARLNEHLGVVNLSLGPVFKTGHKLLFDIAADMAAYNVPDDVVVGRFNFTPHYALKKGRWSVDVGVRLDMMFASVHPVSLATEGVHQYVYPDVSIDFAAIRDALDIYLDVKGGTRMNTYSSIIESNHHFSMAYCCPGMCFFDADVENVRASFGFRGRISSNFSYDLRGGLASYANALLPAVCVVGGAPIAGIAYAGYQTAFAALDWRWDAESFKFDGTVNCTNSWGYERADWAFAPASLTGTAAFEYNWMRRIFVGVDCDFSTCRKMVAVPVEGVSSLTIPGYADLSVSFEYARSKKLSFWLRGGNLCCMTIQRTPLYAEGGVSVIAGICLNL